VPTLYEAVVILIKKLSKEEEGFFGNYWQKEQI